MKIIKCGGSILKDYINRKNLYENIKKEQEKVILVVSAFNDTPYSTQSLKELLTNNYNYEMEQELLVIGEIISSIRVCNELLNEYVDATLLYKENIGIYVKTSDKMEEIVSLDNKYLLNELKEHKVIVVPGFIGINQDNKIVTLNENGSDLTAILIAKMLDENNVYLYKDVLGLASIDPNKSSNYKLYKKVSYDLLSQVVSHGSNLIQNEAIKQAKENKITIHIQNHLNQKYETTISMANSERTVVFQQKDKDIYIDGYNQKESIESILNNKKIRYDYILPCTSYLKIVTSFNNQKDIINTLHNNYLKGII